MRKAINIQWDTDGNPSILDDLPTEILIPDTLSDEEDISDYISNETGFCHNGYKLINVQYCVKITYSNNDSEEPYGHFETKEDAYKTLCQLAAKEAYVQNEEFLERNTCSIFFDAYEYKANLHYDVDNTYCYYRVEEIPAEENDNNQSTSVKNNLDTTVKFPCKKGTKIRVMTDNKERIGHCIGYKNTYTDKWEIAVCIENYADEYLYVADLNKTWFIVE